MYFCLFHKNNLILNENYSAYSGIKFMRKVAICIQRAISGLVETLHISNWKIEVLANMMTKFLVVICTKFYL